MGIQEHQEMVKNWVSLTSSMMSFVTPVMTVINCLVSVTVSVWQMGHGVAVCQHVHVRIVLELSKKVLKILQHFYCANLHIID